MKLEDMLNDFLSGKDLTLLSLERVRRREVNMEQRGEKNLLKKLKEKNKGEKVERRERSKKRRGPRKIEN